MKNDNLTTPQRQRTSVVIQGLDTSTPDDLVKDGKCETLHNMRFNAEAWRPVHKHKSRTFTLFDTNEYRMSIVYRHPVVEGDVYIARYADSSKNKFVYASYDISSDKHTPIAEFEGWDNGTNAPKISHFGNVLMFTQGATTVYYLYTDGTYKFYDRQLPLPTSISTSRSVSEKTTPNPDDNDAFFVSDTPIGSFYKGLAYKYTQLSSFLAGLEGVGSGYPDCKITLYQRVCGLGGEIVADTYKTDSSTGKDLIYGNLCYVIAYKGEDGSILQVSPLQLITRTANFSSTTELKVGTLQDLESLGPNTSNTGKALWFTTVIDLKRSTSIETNTATIEDIVNCPFVHEDALISFTLPSEVLSSPLFASVAVYCSLPTEIYQTMKLKEQYNGPKTLTPKEAYNTEDLFNQPLYLLSETLKADIPQNRVFKIQLSESLLSSMISKGVYTPSSYAPISAKVMHDYNMRLHLADVAIDYLSYPHINVLNTGGPSSYLKTQRLGVAIESAGRTRYILPSSYTTLGSIKNSYIISIPDTSIKSFLSNIQNQNIAVYPFAYAYGNGFAYYTLPATQERQFPKMELLHDYGTVSSSAATQEAIQQPNRLQVSESNNCFLLPYDLSYRVGSEQNRIIAMQSAAIKIGDEQVGALPLYVFTEEGIFALRAGESTLYSAVNPINHDRIINPSTISVNGAVAYITEKGVHILTGDGSKVISTPIHGADGIPDIDFLKSCVFLAPKQFNEIVLLDNIGDTHYVYNLDYGYWSTRELEGEKINTDELVDNKAGIIYDLNDEDEDVALDCKIKTRPIKLGNVDYKRLETIIPRMRTTNDSIELGISLEASNDGSTYVNLYKTDSLFGFSENINNPLVIRRVPFSAKYFKLQLNVIPVNEEQFATSITHIDFEWYRRFSRRMR